jgi:O-acetyl-ADP-ribose deacetylase (regulator of RNase III)
MAAEEDVVAALRYFWDADAAERPKWLLRRCGHRNGPRGSLPIESPAAIPHEFGEWLRSAGPPERRAALRAALTMWRTDPPTEVMNLVDCILDAEATARPIVHSRDLLPHPDAQVVVWKGDITLLAVDAIVNAANAAMLGCFKPDHPCIDNAIHSIAGPRLREACRGLMLEQGHAEPTGAAKVTPAFHLPCKFVLHTVGPIVTALDTHGRPPAEQRRQLAQCYVSCLDLAVASGCRSVAFCCISTGVFGYPQEAAAHVALATVRDWLGDPAHSGQMTYVVFNVFLPSDLEIYTGLLPIYFPSSRVSDEPLPTQIDAVPSPP